MVSPTHPTLSRLSRVLRRITASTVVLGWTILGTSCALWVKTKSPVPTIAYPQDQHSRAEMLIVFLPGRGDKMEDFERHDFLRTLRAAGVKADAIAVGAHLGYYYQRTIITRLQEDVLRPARERGYRRIVLVGISLGGLGATLAARDATEMVDGLVLIAPYLGKDKALLRDLERRGGPAAWAAGRPLRSGKVDEEIWTFLGQKSDTLPPTLLCFGSNDYLRQGQQIFAKMLPPERVLIRPGAHDWKTWGLLWSEVCNKTDFFRQVEAKAAR